MRSGLSSSIHDGKQNELSSIKRERPRSVARQSSLPTLMPETATESSNNETQASRPLSESRGQWDEFEALATSRLKSPVGTPTRPPSNTIPPSFSNPNSGEYCGNKPKMGIKVDERSFKDCNAPALASRRPVRTPVNFQERCSDTWLDRAQELAVQKEACLLFQTDLASLRHRERHKEPKINVSHLGKDLQCASLEQNVNVYPPSHTVQMPRDENLNIVQNGQENILAEGGLNIGPKNLQYGYEHRKENSQCSASDRTVPSMPFCLSDCDTTVSESLCSDFQAHINPESSSEPKPVSDQHENIITTGNISIPDSNNNNTNDMSQFAFIDCDSSASDVNQRTFGMIGKHGPKALAQCPNAADFDSSEILLVCGFSSVPPQNLFNKQDELGPLSLKETPDSVVITSAKANSNHYEKPCDNLEQHSIQSHSHFNVMVESKDFSHKESSVSPQTIPHRDRDDESMTAQLKPEATEDNSGIVALHEVECRLIYDKIKTNPAEFKTDVNISNVPLSESHKISESPSTFIDGVSFEDLHAQVAPKGPRSPSTTEVKSARIKTRSTTNSPKNDTSAVLSVVTSDIGSTKPLLSDFPLCKSPSPLFSYPNATSDPNLSLLTHYPTTRPGLGSTLAEASYTTSTLQLQAAAKHTLTPEEAEPASSRPPAEESR